MRDVVDDVEMVATKFHLPRPITYSIIDSAGQHGGNTLPAYAMLIDATGTALFLKIEEGGPRLTFGWTGKDPSPDTEVVGYDNQM